MKFLVQRSPLLNALQKVQSVVEKRNTVPILGNILCTAKGQELSICATDLEVGIKITFPVEVQEEGKITLPAKNFLDIIKELPEKPLQILSKENNWIEILCQKSKFNIVSLSASEYPSLPNFEEKTYSDAQVDKLINMIDSTSFAVSTDATRYTLNGVFFEPVDSAQKGSVMRMTATDGHRLSFIDHEVFLSQPELKRGVIVPKKGLGELRKFLAEGGSTIGLSFERGYLFAKFDGAYMFIRLIDGEYPPYQAVIPKNADRLIRMNREAFTSALKRASLLAHEKSRGVKLVFNNGQMVITSSNPDMGEATEEMDVEYSGESLEIGFNSKYLLECLNVVEGEKLELHLKDRLSPGILRAADKQNHTYVIMPMRI